MMKKFVCGICGFVYEGTEAPEKCPQCGAPKEKFTELVAGVKEYADEHRVGIAKGVDERILEGLHLNFTGECSEVGMYLAMSRVADRQGYPEVAEAYKRIAFEEAEHAAKFAELLGEVVTDDTKTNLEMRAAAEQGACAGKKNISAWPVLSARLLPGPSSSDQSAWSAAFSFMAMKSISRQGRRCTPKPRKMPKSSVSRKMASWMT